MKTEKIENELRRIISYRKLDALQASMASNKTHTPAACLPVLAKFNWFEAVEYCLSKMSGCRASILIALEAAALANALESYRMLVEWVRLNKVSSRLFDSMVVALDNHSDKVIQYGLEQKIISTTEAVKWISGFMAAGQNGVKSLDVVLSAALNAKSVSVARTILTDALKEAFQLMNVGGVRMVLDFCRKHKVKLTDSAIIEGVKLGFPNACGDIEFLTYVLEMPEIKPFLPTSVGSEMLHTTVLAGGSLGIKRLLEAGAMPTVKSIEYLAGEYFEAVKNTNGLVCLKDDKDQLERTKYQLSVLLPKSGYLWRLVKTKAAVRGLIHYFGENSPQGHDLTAKLFLM